MAGQHAFDLKHLKSLSISDFGIGIVYWRGPEGRNDTKGRGKLCQNKPTCMNPGLASKPLGSLGVTNTIPTLPVVDDW